MKINTRKKWDYYHVPSTENLLKTLNSRNKFKHDFFIAYQQLKLNEESQEILTINKYKGIYKPPWFQFSVPSRVRIFQRKIEKAQCDSLK